MSIRNHNYTDSKSRSEEGRFLKRKAFNIIHYKEIKEELIEIYKKKKEESKSR